MSETGQKAREDFAKQQARITKSWQMFYATPGGKAALDDLFAYINNQKEMYYRYGEDLAMPHPNPTQGLMPIDLQMAGSLLQSSRGMTIVKTYIQNRIDMNVAQPNKTTK